MLEGISISKYTEEESFYKIQRGKEKRVVVVVETKQTKNQAAILYGPKLFHEFLWLGHITPRATRSNVLGYRASAAVFDVLLTYA